MLLRFKCNPMCSGVDFYQTEEKEFEVLDTAQGLGESLSLGVELFDGGGGGAVDVVVENFVVI